MKFITKCKERREKRKRAKYEKQQKKYDEIIKEETQKRRFKDQLKSIRVDTFTKALVMIITIVALIDLQLSYVLAFMDKIQIAESLSVQICITILGVAFVYMIRAYFDSKAEHSNESTKKEMEEAIGTKIQNILNNAGINVNLETILGKNNIDIQQAPNQEIHVAPPETMLFKNENNDNDIVG